MRGVLIAAVIVAAAVAVDEAYNFGYYTNGTIAMLRDIQRSFGF